MAMFLLREVVVEDGNVATDDNAEWTSLRRACRMKKKRWVREMFSKKSMAKERRGCIRVLQP